MIDKFFISSEDSKKRLDKFLVEKFPSISRTKIQKLIEEEKILVNKKKVAKHCFLEEGDEIEIENIELLNSRGAICRVPTEVIANSTIPFFVLFESPHYIIIEKPAGVAVHQAETHPESDTLVNGLVAKYPEILHFVQDDKNVCHGDKNVCHGDKNVHSHLRPGIVHRLDKDVSGVMVVARTGAMFEHLKKQFQERLVKKLYIALVHGKIRREEDEIHFNIGRSKKDKRKMVGRPTEKNFVGVEPVRPESKVAQARPLRFREAITYFETLKHFERYTLLKVQIKTGRTHQIRVHLNAYAHPIVGDEVYRPKNLKTNVNLGRLFLHAEALGFYDLEGNWMEYKSQLPKELSAFLQKVK